MNKSFSEVQSFDEYKKLTLDLSEEFASQLFKFARDAGAPPEVLAAAILTSHVENGSLDASDLRDS
jgi:hypothetical protein